MADESVTLTRQRGVYVIAFLCEKLLIEKNDVATAMRLVDVFNVELPAPKLNSVTVAPPIEADLVVIFKSQKPEQFRATVALVKPSGERTPATEYECQTGGGVIGQTIAIHVQVDPREPGDYWFEISIEDRLATKVPLRVTQTVRDPHARLTQPNAQLNTADLS